LTRRQYQVLALMAANRDDEDGELVYERGVGYVGLERVGGRTLFALLRMAAISLAEDSEVGGFERYHINETGLELLKLRGLVV